MMIEVTPRQNEYLNELAKGQRTARELMSIFGVTAPSVRKIMRRLIELDLAKSYGRIAHVYELATSYDTLELKVVRARPGRKDNLITEDEIQHAAYLRNEGMTGYELVVEFQKTYPSRTNNSLKGLVRLAKVRGLCR